MARIYIDDITGEEIHRSLMVSTKLNVSGVPYELMPDLSWDLNLETAKAFFSVIKNEVPELVKIKLDEQSSSDSETSQA